MRKMPLCGTKRLPNRAMQRHSARWVHVMMMALGLKKMRMKPLNCIKVLLSKSVQKHNINSAGAIFLELE